MGAQLVAGPRGPRGPALLAWVLPAALALSGLGLSLTHPRVADLVTGHDVGDTVMAIACGVTAGVILAHRPRHPVGRVFAVIGVADGVSTVASGLGDIARPGAPGAALALWLDSWAWLPGVLLPLTVLPLVFPEGVRGRYVTWLLRVEVGVLVLGGAAKAVSPRLSTGPHSSIANPVGVPGASGTATTALALALVCAAASVGVLVVRLVRADDRLRRQMLPLVAAGVLVIPAVAFAGRGDAAGAVVQDLAILLIPVAALFAVLRMKLFDLEVAIGRTAAWLVVSAVLLGAYVLVVQLTGTWLHLHGGIASVLATAVVALALGPVRATVQRWVARWLYGDRGDPYAALAHTTQVLAGGADPVGALRQATADLAHRLRTPGARVVRDGRVLAGDPGGRAALVVPLRSGDVEVARLEVLPRSPGELFTRADQRLVLDLCAPLANAVAAVALQEELQASRERLALSREAERRRVRTELHDDVGPALATAAVQSRVAQRRLARADAEGASQALSELTLTIRHAASDLRSAIDALGPGVLEELGLAGAVQALATEEGPPAVRVDVGELEILPAAVEVAVYRVIAEALTNARRHAAASCVTVRLRHERGDLELVVEDDGIGVGENANGPRSAAGVGVPSMRARVEELGGALALGPRAAGPGTRLRATVPVPPGEVCA